MSRPTLRTISRLLAPWRTICKLWAINRRLQRSNDRLSAMVFLACSKNVAKDRRLRHCPTHGQQPPNAWGCPVCMRQLRGEVVTKKLEANGLLAELATAKQDAEYLRGDLATAREAVRRLVRWGLEGYDSEVLRGVYNWFIINAMAGPLLPLPESIVKREAKDGTKEHH